MSLPGQPDRPEVDYDDLWQGSWGDLQRYGPTSRHQRRIIASLVSTLDVESILDVGCGEGSTLAFLRGIFGGASLAGLDVSAAALAHARRVCPSATYHLGAARELPADSRFDLVTCIDVLEHVEEDVALLAALAALSSRYVLCATVQGTMRPGEEHIGHVRNYRVDEVQDKMRLVGLEPIRTVEWGFPFFSPIFRSLVSSSRGETLTFGRYGPGRRVVCHALYALFLLNSWRHGDKLFVLSQTTTRCNPTRSGSR